MTSTAPHTSATADDRDRDETTRHRVSRRLALLIALGAVVVLALGWAVDGLGTLSPTTHFTSGATQQAGLYRVALALDPNPPKAAAQAHLVVVITDATGAAVRAAQVRLDLTMPTMDMSPVALTAASDGKGGYATETTFPMSGAWTVTVHLTPPGADPVQTTFHIAVR